MQKIKMISIVFVVLLFAFTANARADEGIMVTAEGMAAIKNNNTAMARDLAIQNALRIAVEQAVGTMIASETAIENYQVLSDSIYAKTQGYIQNYRITSEKSVDNLYQVIIQARAAKGKLKNDLMALGLLMARKNMPRVMIMVAEQNVGQTHYSYWWHAHSYQADLSVVENTLMEKLVSKGFNVVDHSVKTKTLKINAPYKVVSLSNTAIKTLGNLFDAEVVIYGKALAKTAGSVMGTSMKSVQADLSLRAVNTDTGQVIASATKHSAAVHISEITAGGKALALATNEIADNLLNQIIKRWSQDVNQGALIQIIITGVNSNRNLVKFKSILKNRVRGISGVFQRGLSSGTATLDIQLKGTAQNLADEISMIDFPGFIIDVTDITANSIKMKMSIQ